MTADSVTEVLVGIAPDILMLDVSGFIFLVGLFARGYVVAKFN